MSNIDFLINQLDFCVFCLQQRDAVGEIDLKDKFKRKKIVKEIICKKKFSKESFLSWSYHIILLTQKETNKILFFWQTLYLILFD